MNTIFFKTLLMCLSFLICVVFQFTAISAQENPRSLSTAFKLSGKENNQEASSLLPSPTGSYAVGTTIFSLIDTNRPDTISKKNGQFRQLMLQVWYPSNPKPNSKKAPYLPDAEILKAFLENQYNFQAESVLKNLQNIEVSAFLDAPISKKEAKYPLLIFSPGLGEPRSNYTALSQELASHGYIVITVDHPYGGYTVLPNKRILTTNEDARGGTPEGAAALTIEWSQDVAFILNQLASYSNNFSILMKQIIKRIDMKKVGMLGHSLGGAAALEACRSDLRFRACSDLDGAPFGKVKEEGVKKPTLVMRNSPIYSDEDLAKKGRTREQWEQMGREGKKMWDTILPRNTNTPFYTIKVAGTGHMSFSDAAFTMPDTITRFGGSILDFKRAFQIISGYTLDFFNKYLKNEPSRLLDKSAFTEASVERVNTNKK